MDKKESARLAHVLETALAVFARYGFRKTSIEDIAKAAGISRQGIYLHFKNKDEILNASIHKSLDDGIEAAERILEDSRLTLEERLFGALDEWLGRHVGLLHPEASDLAAHCERILGSAVGEGESLFQKRLVQAILSSSSPEAGEREKRAETIVGMLYACAVTWKHTLQSRQEFAEKMRGAIQLVCRDL